MKKTNVIYVDPKIFKGIGTPTKMAKELMDKQYKTKMSLDVLRGEKKK